MKKVLFLYLDAFSQTGGIEKFNKAFMKALTDISKDGEINYKAFSVCDDKPDIRYINSENHRGFQNKKYSFTLQTFFKGIKSDVVIVGHLNLAPVGLLLKIFKPQLKILLIAHGIEVWNKQPFLKSKFIKKVDLIFAVSNFTRNNILAHNNIPSERVVIFPNTLDPFFKIFVRKEKPSYLLERYGLTEDNKIILTITRVNKHETYKGYDKVLEVIPDIIKKVPAVKYILGGKYEPIEEARLKNLVETNKLKDHFILTGFIPEEELIDHYFLADVFVLPSKKEGFGIVFIEAAVCGLPIIAGNQDGSTDALLDGKLGKLINPDSVKEMSDSIIEFINNPPTANEKLVLENFGFEQFRKRLRIIITES